VALPDAREKPVRLPRRGVVPSCPGRHRDHERVRRRPPRTRRTPDGVPPPRTRGTRPFRVPASGIRRMEAAAGAEVPEDQILRSPSARRYRGAENFASSGHIDNLPRPTKETGRATAAGSGFPGNGIHTMPLH